MFTKGQSGNPGGRIVHGHYRKRERTCEACGTPFVSGKPNARYCSLRCLTAHGPWAYQANVNATARHRDHEGI